jgi:tetratricopeptide (TPR) repeat protein
LPQEWAATQNNLGIALQDQGTRTGGEEGRQLLAQGMTAYRAALEVYTREQLPQDWARTQNNLGIALQDQGTRTGGEEGRQLMAQAVTAYRAALEVRTRESLPPQWAQTHNNLAQTYLALSQWADAAQSLRNVLLIYSNSAETYSILGGLYHERLFEFQAAFDLHQAWLERHPGDLAARENRAEAAFTVGRFAEAEEQLGEVLGEAGLRPGSRVALHALEIAALVMQRRVETIPKKLQDLLDLVSAQPADFHVEWGWDGTVHFIQTAGRLAQVRSWLLSFFEALKGKDRVALLGGLRTAASRFATLQKP